jgi:hypothetical protein
VTADNRREMCTLLAVVENAAAIGGPVYVPKRQLGLGAFIKPGLA